MEPIDGLISKNVGCCMEMGGGRYAPPGCDAITDKAAVEWLCRITKNWIIGAILYYITLHKLLRFFPPPPPVFLHSYNEWFLDMKVMLCTFGNKINLPPKDILCAFGNKILLHNKQTSHSRCVGPG